MDNSLTPSEAAKLLKVSTLTVYRMIKNKKLPAKKFGKKQIRINRADVMSIIFQDIKKYYNQMDAFTNPSISNYPEDKIFGYTNGFITTTAYISSKKMMITKEDVIGLWEQLKNNPKLWTMLDNHQTEKKPAGVLVEAQLLERDDWMGIYAVTAITDNDLWAKTLNGEYKGYSIGIRQTEDDQQTRKTKTAVIDIEAKSFTEEEMQEIQASFSKNHYVAFNQVYRFSELPPLIIVVQVSYDLSVYLPIILSTAGTITAATVTIHIIKKLADLMIEDVYEATKKMLQKLKNKKEERKPIVVYKLNVLGKKLSVKFVAEDNLDIDQTIQDLKNSIPDIFEKNEDYVSSAKNINIERINGRWQIEIEEQS